MELSAEKWGYPERWSTFAENHAVFLEKFAKVESALKKALVRDISDSPPGPFVVVMLGCLAVESFREIALLCGNGCGIAALRQLRSMYEGVVTASYVSRNPHHAGRFLNFHHYQVGKLLERVEELGRVKAFFPEEAIPVRKNLYQRVKKSFEHEKCPECKKKPMPSWSKLDVKSMAGKSHPRLLEMHMDYYTLPNFQVHTSAMGIFHRLRENEAGQSIYEPGPQPRHVDLALRGGHDLLLVVLEEVNSFLMLGMHGTILQLRSDFNEVWPEAEISTNENEEER